MEFIGRKEKSNRDCYVKGCLTKWPESALAEYPEIAEDLRGVMHNETP